MNTVQFLSYLRELGVRITLDGDRLRVKAGAGVLTQDVKAQLADRKDELLAFLQEAQVQLGGAAALLSQLRKIGVKIWLDGDKLRVKAAGGLLSPELKRRMADQKADIITFLRQAQGGELDVEEGGEEVVLDPATRRQWIMQQLLPDAPMHLLSLVLEAVGPLDAAHLREALDMLLQRHPPLRTVFPLQDGKPTIRCLDTCKLVLEEVALDHLPVEAHDAACEQALFRITRHPFSLEAAPLLRVALIRLASDRAVLVLTLHRIVADHWSMQPLLHELVACYEAAVHGRRLEAKALQETYRAVASERQSFFNGALYKEHLAWWAARLEGWPMVFELPGDRPRKDILTFNGDRVPVPLTEAHHEEIRSFCRAAGVAPDRMFLAVFCVLLHRYSGKDHFLVATSSPGRNEQSKALIGRFANMPVLRADVMGNPDFSALVARLAEEVDEMATRPEVAPTHLAEELQQDPDMCRNPICQVRFVYKEPIAQACDMAGVALTPLPNHMQTSQFDLTLRVVRHAGYQLELEYNVDLFDRETVARMADHYARLAHVCTLRPDRPVGELPMLGEAERARIVEEWNRTERAFDRDPALHHLFEQQVRRTPDEPAVLAGAHGTLTYREINARANRLAHFLADRGIGTDAFVGIFTTPSLETVVAVLAVLKCGGAFVPMHPSLPKHRLSFMLEDTGATTVLTVRHLAAELPDHAVEHLCLDTDWGHVKGFDDADLDTPADSAQNAYVIYTPMSTGMPKAVVASHLAVTNRLLWLQETFPLSADDRLLQRTPLTSGTASNELFWPLICGARLVLPTEARFTNYEALVRVLAGEKITTVHLVPYGLEKLLQEPLLADCVRLKRVFCGAEALERELVQTFHAKMPHTELINLYGSTEAGGEITAWRCRADDVHPIAPIGRPIANTQVYLLDPYMEPVPVGVPGELYVSGSGLAAGYLNRQALTHERFVANPFSGREGGRLFKTGDRARYLADGNIEFLGRTDWQVKVRGVRVDLEEIEAALTGHEMIRECVADFRRNAFGEPRLVAYFVSNEPATVSHAGLDAYLAETLPKDIIPATYVRTESMPLTSTGKIDRERLPVPEEFQRQRDAFPRAYSEVERVIARAWRKVLNVDKVGVDENFFDLGGDSLQMLEVYHHLPDMLKRSLEPTSLFQFPTIHDLGLHLEREEDEADFTAKREDLAEKVDALSASWAAEPGMNLAVIGWSGRFPGAGSPSELWQNLLDGKESVTFFSKEALLEEGVDEELAEDPYYVPARAVLDDIRAFDAAFFRMTSKEAALTDPQQRLFLECAYEALEHAGYASPKSDRAIGLFAGCGESFYYTNHLRSHPSVSESIDGFTLQIGNGKDYLCTRTSHLLGLRGTAVTVQAGAATSMMAVAGAAHAVLAGECHAAIAGGVYLGPTERCGYLRRTDTSFSPDGHCRPFDAAAAGQVPGQGCALVVLKKIEHALADGDAVHAVLRGLAIANNGGRGTFGAPCEDTWIETIQRAHGAAGVSTDSITYIETEGSGDPEQDAVEARVLTRIFEAAGAKPKSCFLGSIKANIGSLEHASSAAALIKACLVVRAGFAPANIHFRKPLPQLDRPDGPFVLNQRPEQWDVRPYPRRAGVNIFDRGGHHGHIVVEEPPILPPAPRRRPWHLLTLSAGSAEGLDAMTRDLAAHLKARPHLDFSDVCFTLSTGRNTMKHRRMVVAQNLHEAILELEQHNPERVFSRATTLADRPVAFMFPGQGVQYQNMGRQLYQVEPTYREVVDRCWALVGRNAPDLYENLTQHDRGSRSEKLHQTYVTQPATFITEFALATLLMKWGVTPTCMIGNSLGEYVAATLAGVFSLEDALNLVCTRGRLMQGLPEGRQLAVGLSEEDVLPLLNEELSLAGMAGPRQAMVAGSKEAVDTLKKQLDDRGVVCYRLFTSHAFHSYMMDPILAPFQKAVAALTLHPPKIPFISTITGTWITDAEATDAAYWARQFRLPVRFSQGLSEILTKWGDLVALEVGPDKQLSTMAIRHPAKTRKHLVLATMRQPMEEESDMHHLLNTLGRLWLNGYPVDWDGFHEERRNRRLVLPTYPFQRKPYWLNKPGAWDVEEPLLDDGSPVAETEEENYRAVPTDLVAPRDAVEAEIAGYWQQILGAGELGIYDDFFELGGNSLIGVRLVNMLRRKLRVPLANPILLQKRNVAALSDYIKEIRALGSGEGDQNSIIVQLQRGERGTTPLFLFHPIEGDVLIYRQLVDYLGAKQPVYAVQARSLVGGEAFADIPAQATAYLADIRKIQPRGPFLMAGFSYGGFLAYEISRLLMAKGEKVGFTAMIDSSHPSTVQMNMQNPVEILKFLTGYVIDFPQEEYLGLSDEEQIAYAESRIRAANRAALIPPVFGLEMCRTWLGHQKALTGYDPKPFAGRVMFFNATELMGEAHGGGYYPWLDLVQGGLELHHVPGHHISIMNVPDQVKIIAKQFKRALRTVR